MRISEFYQHEDNSDDPSRKIPKHIFAINVISLINSINKYSNEGNDLDEDFWEWLLFQQTVEPGILTALMNWSLQKLNKLHKRRWSEVECMTNLWNEFYDYKSRHAKTDKLIVDFVKQNLDDMYKYY